jgi:hypothetical protein
MKHNIRYLSIEDILKFHKIGTLIIKKDNVKFPKPKEVDRTRTE